jgi:hypothetical protein
MTLSDTGAFTYVAPTVSDASRDTGMTRFL